MTPIQQKLIKDEDNLFSCPNIPQQVDRVSKLKGVTHIRNSNDGGSDYGLSLWHIPNLDNRLDEIISLSNPFPKCS